MKISRRQFARQVLRTAAAAGLAGLAPGRMSAGDQQPAPRSTVAVAHRHNLKRTGDDIDRNASRDYLERALSVLTGRPNALSAMQTLFRPGEKVGIKLSCVPGIRLSSSRGLVWAIADSLIAAGITPADIVVWDRSSRELERAGFSAPGSGVRVRGTDSYPGWGYSDQVEISGSVGSCFSLILYEVDALVNVPVLKDHDVTGVSIGMKNLYGAVHNPNKYHGNHGDPFIADLCSHPLIRGKLRLTVCDASRVQIHNGPAFSPGYAVEYGGLLASRDPVALDLCGWEIVEQLRKIQRLPALKEEGREPVYIRTAAGRKLGSADVAEIRRVEV